jgi:hypothetical protein
MGHVDAWAWELERKQREDRKGREREGCRYMAATAKRQQLPRMIT